MAIFYCSIKDWAFFRFGGNNDCGFDFGDNWCDFGGGGRGHND